MKTKDTAAGLFKRAFPKAFLGMVYRALLERHVDDLELWGQVLADERADATGDQRRRVRVPWLIEQYQRMQRSLREIDTPPDQLTTYRGNEIERPPNQGKVDFDEVRKLFVESGGRL
jgi:hypothetical protein